MSAESITQWCWESNLINNAWYRKAHSREDCCRLCCSHILNNNKSFVISTVMSEMRCACMCVCVCVCTCTCMHVCGCVWICPCVCVHVCAHMCVWMLTCDQHHEYYKCGLFGEMKDIHNIWIGLTLLDITCYMFSWIEYKNSGKSVHCTLRNPLDKIIKCFHEQTFLCVVKSPFL